MLKYHQVVGVEVNKHEKARILIYYTIIFTTSTGMFSKRLLGGGYPILPTSYATNSGKHYHHGGITIKFVSPSKRKRRGVTQE